MAPPSWVEVIYVIPLYGVSRGLNLNLSSVGGRCLKLTDYYRAETRHYLPDRAKTEAETVRQSRGRGSKVETKARPCEAEARPSQLKKTASSRGRCLQDYIPADCTLVFQCPCVQYRTMTHQRSYVQASALLAACIHSSDIPLVFQCLRVSAKLEVLSTASPRQL